MTNKNYDIGYYTIKSRPTFSEYSLQYLTKMTAVYYGPPFARPEDGIRIITSLFADYLGKNIMEYIDGYYGSRGAVVPNIAVVEGCISEPVSFIVKMVDGELVVSKTNSLEIKEIEHRIAKRNEDEKTKHLIELYEKLSLDDRVKVVSKMIGGTEHDC